MYKLWDMLFLFWSGFCMAESWARRLSLNLACKPFPGLCACTRTGRRCASVVVIGISLCGRTYQTKTDMWGETFYSATITHVPPVTLVLHGLLPLHPLCNIHVLLHNIWHPLSFEQIPLIQIYQINHTLIKTINLQLFLSPWKTLRLFTMIHLHNNNYSLFFHTQNYFVCFLHLLKILLA